MIPPVIRRWLPPVCLVALITAVWALPHRPDCDSLASGDDPAIARIDSHCVLLSHYADWLHVIETAMEHTEQGLIADHPDTDYQRRWYDRVNFYGPETIALGDAIKDSLLYQRALAEEHTPSEEEVSARLDQDRLRWESFDDFIQLVKLAQNQDLGGFRKLAEDTRNPDLSRMLKDQTPSELMRGMKGNNWRQLEIMWEDREALLKTLGHKRYWQQIHPAKLRREMAISKLEEAIQEASADGPYGPYADVPRLGWLAYQQRELEGVSLELTRAAPAAVSVDRALAYLVEVLQEEQDELRGEYERWLERREDRRRPTLPPLRPDSN